MKINTFSFMYLDIHIFILMAFSIKTTLLTHIFNEEYLLPLWLNHHKDMFDNIIIVDYNSTDRSIEICKIICPECVIIKTQNDCFGDEIVDREMMAIENQVEGVKIILNVTEFLFCEIPIKNMFINHTSPISYSIKSISPYSIKNREITNDDYFFRTLLNDDVVFHYDRKYRQLHTYPNGRYNVGRHRTNNETIPTFIAHIVWLGMYPMNENIMKRKLQIQQNIPQRDKDCFNGVQHLWSQEKILSVIREKTEYGLLLKDIHLPLYNLLMRDCKYRAVMLVLASNNNQIYKNCRKVWKKYMNKDPTIKVFFVYGKIQDTDALDDFDPGSDIIFPEIPESYPVLIKKTIEAMKLIHKNIKYDFFIRTNLSTFWDFNKLHLYLNVLPTLYCYSGHGPQFENNSNVYFLSGTDTIVSHGMIESITRNEDAVDFNLIDDVIMGKFFNGSFGAPMLPSRICFFEDIIDVNQTELIRNRIDEAINNDIDHYRVKNPATNRETLDKYVYIELLKKIYGIYD